MPKPADVVGNAIKVAKLATGKIEEDTAQHDGKDKAAAELAGRAVGRAPSG